MEVHTSIPCYINVKIHKLLTKFLRGNGVGFGVIFVAMVNAHRETQGAFYGCFDGRCPSLTYCAPSGRDTHLQQNEQGVKPRNITAMGNAHRETQGAFYVRFDGRCPSLTYCAPSGRDRHLQQNEQGVKPRNITAMGVAHRETQGAFYVRFGGRVYIVGRAKHSLTRMPHLLC